MTLEKKRINGFNCVGCGSCVCICPQNAIDMSENDKGFYKVSVSDDRCIFCGLCLDVCPLINIKKHEIKEFCYASCDKNEESYRKSTSGGIASFVAKKVIENGGVAFLFSSKI